MRLERMGEPIATASGYRNQWECGEQTIKSKLLRLACNLCEHYETDILIDIERLVKNVRNEEIQGIYWFGFRKSGVDSFDYMRIRPVTDYQEAYIIEVTNKPNYPGEWRMDLYKATMIEE